MSQTDAGGMAKNADSDQTAPGSSLICDHTVYLGISIQILMKITVDLVIKRLNKILTRNDPCCKKIFLWGI